MNVYIMTDMEGASGIRRGNGLYTVPDGSCYALGQKFLTEDVNAAIEGALAAGAKRIVVNDAHGGGRHILVESLHPEALLESPVSGVRHFYLPGLDDTFDAMFIIGAHAMSGTPKAFLDHTQSEREWFSYSINGRLIGEIGQYALFAGHYNVPVVLVAGDLAATAEARQLLGEKIEVVAVKEALSRNVARSMHPSKAHALIRKAAEAGLKKIKHVRPLKMKLPLKIKLVLQRTELADVFEGKRNIKRTDARTIEYVSPDQLGILPSF